MNFQQSLTLSGMKRLFLFVFTCALSTATSLAQFPAPDQTSQTTSSQQTSQSIQVPSIGSSMFTTSTDLFRNLQGQGMLIQPPPYDMPVDSNSYVLGPGDIMNVGVWGATPLSYNLSITPEGTLIVPTFGELRVGGATLAHAKEYSRKQLGEQFKKSAITLTLVYPRSFYVIVAGKVRTPGRYTVTSFDRVDRAFTLANLPRSSSDTAKVLPNFSLRRIELLHKDGKSQNVDLLKFFMTGNLADDPYLREGDAIIVPEEDFAAGSISISGAVKMPGNYEYVTGDRLKDLLELSQGLTTLADSAQARIISWNGRIYNQKTVNLDDSSAVNMPLGVNSRVVVPTDLSKVNDFYVWIGGEVQSPGIYPISRDSTRLSTAIGLAGGFTKWASLADARIFRVRRPNQLEPSKIDTLTLISRATGITEEDLPYIALELKMRHDMEVVSTNFVETFVDKDSGQDCTLRSGDIIYVPRNSGAVYVFGQVKTPGYVDYHTGWGWTDYLKAAGGFTDGAEIDKVKIIKGGTYQWCIAGGTELDPGDFVFVPRVSIKTELYSWDLIKDIIGTVGAVASIAATVILVVRTAAGK